MSCPLCGSRAEVLETRWSQKHKTKRRRMQCVGCKFRFTLIGDDYQAARKKPGNA